MSIIESLTKLVDPVQAQAREEERKVARELPKREPSGAPPEYVCRVCGLRSTADGSFCPTCLAGTMERVTKRAP
jgi:rubrerythrin